MSTHRASHAAWLIGVLVAFLTALASAQTQTTSYGPFSVVNASAGQLSSPYFTFSVTTASQLDVEYVASAGHCSNVIMHFLVDGIERAVSATLAPGQSSGFFTLGPVSPGTHLVGLQAEGVVSGCNTGQLAGWGGIANVRAIPIAVAPTQIPGPGLIATALFFLGGAWLTLRRRLRDR
jgi:hypothetical protein